MPLFSIIIPVYNAEKYLRAALDSVLAQKGASYEIVLVENGSEDGTSGICREYAARYDFIRVFSIENHGAAHARNFGMDCVTGEYILFMDGDDLWKPGMLSALGGMTADAPDMILFGSEKFGEGTPVQPKPSCRFPRGESGETWLRETLAAGAVPPPYMWCYVYKRSFLQEHGLRIEEELVCSEDFDFNMRAIPLAKSILGTGEIFYRWRQVPTSLSHTLTAAKLMNNLTTKAQVYDRYPCGALANLYMDNAVLLSRIPRDQAGGCAAFLKEHRRIEKACTQRPLKLASGLFSLLGVSAGARVYGLLHQIKQGIKP